MGIDYRDYHRDREYRENANLFRNIFQKRFNIISGYIKNPERILDIGCSNGIFLDLFEDSETWGIEPSSNANKINDKHSLPHDGKKHKIINSYFEDAKLPENYFDLVIMNHTLEHLKDADKVLCKIYKILKKDGILFIDVPNAGGFGSIIFGNKWSYRLPQEHIYQFTKESLSEKLLNCKFKMLHWESRSGIFELANPFLDIWESLIGFKKRFFTNILLSPYYFFVTMLNMGDSMSFICKKDSLISKKV